MEWLNFIASVSAALAGLASAYIAWKVYKKQAAAEEPFLTVDFVGPISEARGFAEIRFHLTNPGDTHWIIDRADLIKPRGAAVLNEALIPRSGPTYNPGEPDYGWIPPEGLTRSTRFQGTLEHYGACDAIRARSNVCSGVLLFYPRSSKREIKASIRFILVSKEADQRKITIAMKRTLKAAATTESV